MSDWTLNRPLGLQCGDGLWARADSGSWDLARSDCGVGGLGKGEQRWMEKNGGTQRGLAGPARFAEERGVGQPWGMGRLGVGCTVRLKRQ